MLVCDLRFHVLTFVQKDKIKTCVSNARKLRENIHRWSITLIKCTFYLKYTTLSIYMANNHTRCNLLVGSRNQNVRMRTTLPFESALRQEFTH